LLLKLPSDFPGYADRRIKPPAGRVDNLLSYPSCSPLAWSAMFDGTVYYCWSCDAHRKAELGPEEQAICPRCGQPLAEDSRLSRLKTGDAGPAPLGRWAAPEVAGSPLRRRVG
jgi:hypothetical protein